MYTGKTSSTLRHVAAFSGPIAFLTLPKCPLCLLPLLAATGLAISPGAALDLLVLLFAALWGGGVWSMLRSPTALVGGVLVGGVAVAGRWLDEPVLGGGGLAAMMIVAIALLLVPRVRHARCSRALGRNPGADHRNRTE